MDVQHTTNHMKARCLNLANVDPQTARQWASRLRDDRDRNVLLRWLDCTPTERLAESFGLTRGRIYQIVNRNLRAIRYANAQTVPAANILQRFHETVQA